MKARFNHSSLVVTVVSTTDTMILVRMAGEIRSYSKRYLTIL